MSTRTNGKTAAAADLESPGTAKLPAIPPMTPKMTPKCVGYRVRMLSRVVTGIFDEELMPVGIKASQLNALITVARMGPSPPTAICRALQMDESTASRNLQRMRQKGWLTCGTGADRRTRVVALTPEGREMLERAYPAWERAQKRASDLLGPEGVAALDQMSKKIRALSA